MTVTAARHTHTLTDQLAQHLTTCVLLFWNLTSVHASRFAHSRVEQVQRWQLPLHSGFSVEANDTVRLSLRKPLCLTYKDTNAKVAWEEAVMLYSGYFKQHWSFAKIACDKDVKKFKNICKSYVGAGVCGQLETLDKHSYKKIWLMVAAEITCIPASLFMLFIVSMDAHLMIKWQRCCL